jgi:tetratricopeptide (TPR) repeat protein
MTVLCLVSCSRDPKVTRQRYLDSGNKYYDRGKYREASLMYRNSIKQDPKFGPAYYHLALVELKQQHIQNAVSALRRAISLLPPNDKDAIDSNVKLAEILLLYAQGPNAEANKKLHDEVDGIKAMLLKRDPNSFEGNKLQAELDLSDSLVFYRESKADPAKAQESKRKMEDAIAGYRKALQIKSGDSSTMLALAKTLALYGELGEAEQLYKQVVDRDKTITSAYTELYKLYIAERKVPEAESILRRAIASHPSDYSLQTLLAAHYFSVNNRPEMTKVLNNLKAHFKEFPAAFTKAGDFYFRIGDADQAMRQYEEGISADKAHKVDYQKRIIEVLIRQGKTAQAYEKDLEILKDNPKDPEAQGLKASFLLDKGDVNNAATVLQSVVTSRPQNFVARFNLGRAYFTRGDLEQARQQFEEAIKLRPDYMPARLAVTQLAIRRGDYDAAIKYAQDTLRINPKSGISVLLEAAAMIQLNRFDEARGLLERILKTNPNQVDTLQELASLNMAQKRYPEALELFQKGYSIDPSALRGLEGMVQVRILQNQPEKAIQLVSEEVAKHQGRPDLRRLLAITERNAGQTDKAISDFQAILGKYRDSPLEEATLYANIGQAYSMKSDYGNAIANMKKARELAPSAIFYASALAQFYNQAGRNQESMNTYREAMKLNPNDPYVLNNLAYLITETGGNLDEALTLAQRSKQQLPSFNEVSDTIGWIYLKKNLSDSAIEIFRDLTKKVPDNATFHYHYAMALAQKGDRATAVKQLKDALQAPKKPSERGEEVKIREMIQKLS